jgi:hypothetical protein
MASVTLTNRNTVNFNSALLSALRDDDNVTLDNTTLIIDSDTRWGYNNCSLRSLITDADTGGNFLIDGTKVWELSFTSSTGNVPILSAIEFPNIVTGETSGAVGEFLGVWQTGSLTPLSATQSVPVALPSSGWIKLRTKTGNFLANEQVRLSNNSTITIANSGKRSWIQLPLRSAANSSINNFFTSLCAIGDWYELGTTNGQYGQQINIPVADICLGLWIETNQGTNEYERWLFAGPLWERSDTWSGVTSLALGNERQTGRFFNQIRDTSTLTIASSSLSGVCGFLPPSGCKIRMPNVFLTTWLSGSPLYNGTAGDVWSQRHNIGSVTYLKFSNVNAHITSLYSSARGYYEITNSSITDFIYLEGGNKTLIKNTCVSPGFFGGWIAPGNIGARIYCANLQAVEIDGVSGFGNYTNSTDLSARMLLPGPFIQIADTSAFTVKNVEMYNWRRNNTSGGSFNRNVEPSLVENFRAVGSSGLGFNGCKDVVIKNVEIGNRMNGGYRNVLSYNNGIGIYSSSNVSVNGLYSLSSQNLSGFGETAWGLNLGDLSNNIKVINIGTEAIPYQSLYGTLNFIDVSDIEIRQVYTQALGIDRSSGRGVFYADNLNGYLSKNILIENVYNTVAPLDNPSFTDSIIRGCRVSMTTAVGNFGDPYGVHWRDTYVDDTTGTIQLLGSTPTSETEYLITRNFNLTGFKSGFPGGRKVVLNNINEQVTWEMPYHALGHTGFATFQPRYAGVNTSLLSAQFQYDNDKNGFNGSWLTLNANQLTSIPIDPSIGIRLKIRLTATQSKTTSDTSMTSVVVYTTTTPQAQKTFYPVPKEQEGQIVNILQNTRVQLYNETQQIELYNDVHNTNTDFVYPYNNGENINPGDIIRMRLTRVTGATAKLRQESKIVATSIGFSFIAEQEDDTVYNNINIDGSTVTEFTPDYPNLQVDINDPNQATSIERLYAWWVYNENTTNGIRNYFNGLVAEDVANFRVNTNIVDLKLDNVTNQGLVFEGDYRLYRDDGQIPIVSPTSGGGSIVLYAGRILANTISVPSPALTQQESNTLLKINTLPQDMFSLSLTALSATNSVGARIKNLATVSNVTQAISDALSI